jgi:ABC-type multidrug transport system fused ATPase/permease subunit
MSVPRGARALREATALLRRERTTLALLLGLMLLNRLCAIALPASAKFVIDDVIGQRRTELLVPLAAIIALAVLVEAATGFVLYRIVGVVSQRVITRLRSSLQAHILRLPVRYFDDTQSGTLLSRVMADPESLRDVLGPGVVQVATGLLTALVALGVLFSLDARLTLLVLAVLLAFLVAMTRGFGWLYPAFIRVGERTAEMTGRLAEVLCGIRVVKTHRAERREAHAFTRESHRLLREYTRAFTGAAALVTAGTLAAGVVNGALLVLGGKIVLDGSMTLGDFVMYAFFVGLLVTPLLQIAATASQVGQAVAALARIAELRALATDDDGDRGLAPLAAVIGHVVFDDVSFAYVPGRPVLHGVSFDVAPGMTIALAGPNGAGKTTVAQLLLRFRHPNEGRVLVDDYDLARIRGRDYRAHTGFVPHDATLFEGTIADNIRYGRPSASPAEVREAARLAHCEEFVERLPDGYATLVGERGRGLSDGQRQRVAIARAFLADPRILVLDEATAQLDLESDLLIQDALRMLRCGRTTFVIAHRLSTIWSADQILLLERGVIVERGSHEDLLARRGRYWRLNEVPGEGRLHHCRGASTTVSGGRVA